MNHPTRRLHGAIFAILLALLVSPQLTMAQDDLPMNIRANAINAAPGGRAAMMEITIDRWTTDEEGETVVNAIKAGNQADIEKAMQKLKPVGKANIQGRMGLDLRVARHYTMQDGSSQIILATDRPISIAEEARGGQSTNFNTSIIILDMPASGDGTGAYYSAVMLTMGESGKIEPNTAGQGAISLGNVKVQEKKK